MELPLLKTKAIHPGVWGVEGADNPQGIRTVPSVKVLYVDYLHGASNDTHDGTDPEHPLKTIQAAVNKAEDYSWIIVSTIDPLGESVVTKNYVVGANYVNLVGAGMSRYFPVWRSDADDAPCLDLRAVGWRISGFNFYAPIESAAIELRHTDTGANDIAIRTIIEGNQFTSDGCLHTLSLEDFGDAITGLYMENGTNDGKKKYLESISGHYIKWNATPNPDQWEIYDHEDSLMFHSTDAVATPNLVTTWIADGGTLPLVVGLINECSGGMAGIETHGCYDVWVIDNVFTGLFDGTATATAILTGTTPLAIPYRNHIIGNYFINSDNHIDMPCNGSRIEHNIVQAQGINRLATVNLRTSLPGNPGDDNIVSRNILHGDYSNTGGFVAGAADMWCGNICSDTLEAEVGDNGFSIARPAV